MLLAVNMPEHEPQVGQAFSSMSCSWARVILLAETLPTASKTVARSIASPVLALPAFMGPPLTKMVGMLTRAAPIIIPGTILSQLGMQTTPSKQWARKHGFNAVGDQLSAGEAVFHADVTHGDSVVYADGVEFEGDTTGGIDGFAYFFTDHIEMGVDPE